MHTHMHMHMHMHMRMHMHMHMHSMRMHFLTWCSLYLEAENPRPEARPKRTPSQPTAVRLELKRKWPRRAAGILLEAPTKE